MAPIADVQRESSCRSRPRLTGRSDALNAARSAPQSRSPQGGTCAAAPGKLDHATAARGGRVLAAKFGAEQDLRLSRTRPRHAVSRVQRRESEDRDATDREDGPSRLVVQRLESGSLQSTRATVEARAWRRRSPRGVAEDHKKGRARRRSGVPGSTTRLLDCEESGGAIQRTPRANLT